MFWQIRWVHWVVVRKTYIEEKGESSGRGDDADVANPNPCPSVIYVKSPVWTRDPQGKASSFQYEVPFVDVVTFLSGHGSIHFWSWTCPPVIGFYYGVGFRFLNQAIRDATDLRVLSLEGGGLARSVSFEVTGPASDGEP